MNIKNIYIIFLGMLTSTLTAIPSLIKGIDVNGNPIPTSTYIMFISIILIAGILCISTYIGSRLAQKNQEAKP